MLLAGLVQVGHCTDQLLHTERQSDQSFVEELLHTSDHDKELL